VRSREARNVFTRLAELRGEHPTWGELLGSLVVLVRLALGVVDAPGSSADRRPRAGPDTETQELMPEDSSPMNHEQPGGVHAELRHQM
jgi:hypothetical protein